MTGENFLFPLSHRLYYNYKTNFSFKLIGKKKESEERDVVFSCLIVLLD